MKYNIEFKPSAFRDLKKLTSQDQKTVIEKIELLEDNFFGDIRKLTNHTPEYRLRVGNFRVLFEIEAGKIIIYRIKHRKESYR